MAIVKRIIIGYSFSTNQKSSNIVQILKLSMSHAHNRPLISCRVSKRTGKHGLFLGLWATLFYGFFCLNMLHSSQMWLVCLLLVRSIFQVFFRRCFGESLHRLPYDIWLLIMQSHVEVYSCKCLKVSRETKLICTFAGYFYLSVLSLWPCGAADNPKLRSDLR